MKEYYDDSNGGQRFKTSPVRNAYFVITHDQPERSNSMINYFNNSEIMNCRECGKNLNFSVETTAYVVILNDANDRFCLDCMPSMRVDKSTQHTNKFFLDKPDDEDMVMLTDNEFVEQMEMLIEHSGATRPIECKQDRFEI